MNILVVYGTTEGQTRKIGERVAARIRENGHQVELRNSAHWQNDFQIDSFDKVIIAGSVHEKRHQRSLEIFVMAGRDKLQSIPVLFLSVSLSAAFKGGLDEAQAYVDSFTEYTEWKPTRTLLVAGALRYEEYDYFMEQIVQHVVLEGRDVDQEKEGDREFTDWEALMTAVDDFVNS